MFTDPLVLMDQTLENLETLSAFLEDESDARTLRSAELTARAQRCRDAQRAIAFLIPKLRAARLTQMAHPQMRSCLTCE